MAIQIPDGDFAAYIFDCDGTLADNMPLHYKAWRAALDAHGCDFPEALFYTLGGVPTQHIVDILNERHGASIPAAQTAAHKEELFLEMLPQILPMEAVVEIVHSSAGRLPMAVASGSRREIVIKILDALGITAMFHTIVTSEDSKRGKPAPDPFLEAARRLDVPPEKCLVFEDTQTGITAAEAAGMQWVLVRPPVRASASTPRC
jgi:beta-phosphoglucomutase family hydrolase